MGRLVSFLSWLGCTPLSAFLLIGLVSLVAWEIPFALMSFSSSSGVVLTVTSEEESQRDCAPLSVVIIGTLSNKQKGAICLLKALRSVKEQTRPPCEVLLVLSSVDTPAKKESMLEFLNEWTSLLASQGSSFRVVQRAEAKLASENRNMGMPFPYAHMHAPHHHHFYPLFFYTHQAL